MRGIKKHSATHRNYPAKLAGELPADKGANGLCSLS